MNAKKFAIYLAPFFVNSALRVVGIPLTTYILNPEEFGLFALMMGAVNICTVLATSVTGYVVNHHAPPGQIAPRGLIATVALLEVSVGLVLAVVCMLVWTSFARWMGIAGDVSLYSFLALLLSVPLGAFWTSGSVMMVFDERAGLYSATMIAQGAMQLAATILALYLLHWRVGALVVGQVTAIATCAVGGYLGLRRHLSVTLDRGVARESVGLMPWSMISGFANSSTDLLERLVLGRVANTYQLGLYVHAQSYRAMFGTAGKAFVQVLQPAMMKDARSGSLDFSDTRDGWNVVYVMFSLFGVVFALVGREIIGLLTHGKFVGAAIYVPFWCIYLTFQYLGRAQVAMLYAHGEGKKISSALLMSNIVSGCLIVALGVPFGAPGLVAAVLCGEVVNRVMLQYWTRQRWNLPFQDFYAVCGALLILGSTALSYLLVPPLTVRISLLSAIVIGAVLLVGPAARRFLLSK
jgi:O-antigen/teichoic acid export membrane protein